MTAVLMVSGSWPPQACGVGDYAQVLGTELSKAGISVSRFASDHFSQLYAPAIVRQIDRADCDLVHIQYPTAGYGRSLTPSMLARRIGNKPVVVTLHEYAVFRPYRRAWFSPFAHHCAARIFTTDEERDLFARRFPRRNGLDLTIEIASNMPVSQRPRHDPNHVCYFGLIAPKKGLEDFIELRSLAVQAASGLTFEIIGAIPERHRRYAEDILSQATSCGIRTSIQLTDQAVADRIASAAFAYLPFPDGASAKRGTLAAAFVNGLIVATRHGSITPDWIRSATLEARAPQDALDAILRLQNNASARAQFNRRVIDAATHFRWSAIAAQHAELYRTVLNRPMADDRKDIHAGKDRQQSLLAS